jgi:hypothetical protein
MGKSLKDPRSLYRVADMKVAGDLFLRDVSSSYSVFLQVPLVRAFVERYQGPVERPHATARISKYTANGTGQFRTLVLDADACSVLCARYNITYSEILRAENLIRSSRALTFLHDPVFLKLAAVDYA